MIINDNVHSLSFSSRLIDFNLFLKLQYLEIFLFVFLQGRAPSPIFPIWHCDRYQRRTFFTSCLKDQGSNVDGILALARNCTLTIMRQRHELPNRLVRDEMCSVVKWWHLNPEHVVLNKQRKGEINRKSPSTYSRDTTDSQWCINRENQPMII